MQELRTEDTTNAYAKPIGMLSSHRKPFAFSEFPIIA